MSCSVTVWVTSTWRVSTTRGGDAITTAAAVLSTKSMRGSSFFSSSGRSALTLTGQI
jgi:hypothetical protein